MEQAAIQVTSLIDKKGNCNVLISLYDEDKLQASIKIDCNMARRLGATLTGIAEAHTPTQRANINGIPVWL